MMEDASHSCEQGHLLLDLPAHDRADLLRAFVDASNDAIIVHEPDGHIVFYSQGACDMLGYSITEMDALEPFAWVAPEAQPGATGRLEAILHEGFLYFESAAVRKDGRTLHTEVTSRRVESPLGPLVVAVIRDVTAMREAQSQLVHLAYHDSLTGLPNRSMFEERLRVAIADAKRFGDLLIVAYLDLDRFKPINDQYGHEAGDTVLKEVGRRLSDNIREQDLVARLGGDEFVLLLQRVESVDEVPGIAERFLTSVREPIPACGAMCEIDASIGFAVFDAEVDDARSVVVKADVAMYEAKRDPLHPWCMYTSTMGLGSPQEG